MDLVGPWETLDVEVDGPVVVVALNRPERMNAISPTMGVELGQFWKLFEDSPEVRVAVVTGAGDRAFCTGADVGTLASPGRARTGVFERDLAFTPFQAGVTKPTICAVNGVCAGGGLHFVVECDFSIAAARATFLDPHVSVGQVSSTETLVMARRIGHQAALRMVLMGRHERIDAQRALTLGLITEIVEDDQIRDRAKELAQLVAKNSPTAMSISRYVLWQGLEKPMTDALRFGYSMLMAHANLHPDAQEGPAAFREKRDPIWLDEEPGGPLAHRPEQ
jgi:enoyl-CoA hydratase/carnithine racemase